VLFRDELSDGRAVDYLSLGPLAVRLTNGNGASPEYIHSDHLGSPVAATSASGAISWRENYTPFGEARVKPAANANQTGYTGHVQDAATGLTYMQARYYDPVIGRFLSTDPIGYQDQLNLYAYVRNDPVNATDPDGKWSRRIKPDQLPTDDPSWGGWQEPSKDWFRRSGPLGGLTFSMEDSASGSLDDGRDTAAKYRNMNPATSEALSLAAEIVIQLHPVSRNLSLAYGIVKAGVDAKNGDRLASGAFFAGALAGSAFESRLPVAKLGRNATQAAGGVYSLATQKAVERALSPDPAKPKSGARTP
jgi:RHS repeat-associated protein